LVQLADSASLIIAEDFPCGPWPAWREQLARRTGCPIWAVDTACILPMNTVGKAYDRAFKFRERTGGQRYQLIDQRTPVAQGSILPWTSPLHFEPDDPLSPEFLVSKIVASMEIDHSVAPVLETPGGERAAVERWNKFRDQHLRQYHLRRNDAADMDGVSNMSPYLHAGFIASWELARQAKEIGGEGAEKWLDELLTWRELSWSFCRFTPWHHSVRAIPDWAMKTLESSRACRSHRPTLDQIERGRTGDVLFDLCMVSLLRHGMLHNNVRMTWGKAIAEWFADPAEGLELALDLNHRYALDGRDPNSYGGILWCWGQFDSPKQSTPRLGVVRDRPTAEHLKRVGEARYRMTQERDSGRLESVLIIGAGMSGLMAGRALQDAGVRVQLVDKGRGVGGRLATRRGEEGELFDHGAQYFTIRDERLHRHLSQWIDAGVVREWAEGFASTDHRTPSEKVARYVGTKGMNSLAKWLAIGLDVRTNIRITRIDKGQGEWIAWAEDGQQSFRAAGLMITCPVEQTLDLLRESDIAPDPATLENLKAVQYDPCFAVMAALDGPSGLPAPGGLFVNDGGPIAWIADNAAKGISQKPTVTIHARGAWSREHFDDDKAAVGEQLVEAAKPYIRAAVVRYQVHRWKFSLPTVGYPEPCCLVRGGSMPLVLAGDAFAGPRIEGAALSGLAAAGRLLQRPQ
jgi:predicted NAD/FAD-dependent oxidoreductase